MRIERRWAPLIVVLLCGAFLAVAALPASGQSAPVLTPSQDTAATPPATWSIRVQDSGWGRSGVAISFAGQQMTTASPTNGNVDVVIAPARRAAGTYVVTLSGNPCAPTASCPTTKNVAFRSIPTSSFNDPCGAVGSTVTLTVTGSHFPPQSFGYVLYDANGPDQQGRSRIPTGSGSFTATFSVVIRDRAIPINVYDVDGNTAPPLSWRAAPCPTTTTSSTTVPPSTTITTAPPDDTVPDDTTTTTRPPVTVPGTPVTVPPAIDLPPPTPGATLTVTPELGPAGFVAGASGTGFPPGAVTLTWSPGIGATTAVVGPDGTFQARVLVFPNDRLGPRALVATAGATSAFDAFLVVQSSVQPSGQDVRQINRIRRFNQR